MHGARAAGGHLGESAAQGLRNCRGAVDHPVPLGHRPEQRRLIQLGQGEPPARRRGDIGGHRQQRHRGLVRLGHARQDVGRTAAARPFADTDLAGDPRIAVGHVGGRALVPRQDMGDAVIEARQRVIERQAGIAAQAEDMGRRHAAAACAETLRPLKADSSPARSRTIQAGSVTAAAGGVNAARSAAWFRRRGAPPACRTAATACHSRDCPRRDRRCPLPTSPSPPCGCGTSRRGRDSRPG